MNGKDIELSRRRVLGGVATIGAASAAAGAGTFAYFSDTESSSGNKITAGTLNLTGGSNGAFTSVTFDSNSGTEDPLVPGDSGYIAWDLKNDGTIDGSVDVNIGNVDGSGVWQGANLDSESEGTPNDVTTSGSEPDGTGGDLDEALEITASLGSTDSSEGVYTGASPTFSGTPTEFITSKSLSSSDVLKKHETNYSLASTSTTQLVLEYNLPGSGTSNWVQGDSATVDIQVELNQRNTE